MGFFGAPYAVWALLSVVIYAWIRFVKTGPVYKGKKKLNGKTVLITGANCGIGKATAIELAKRNARVIIACRNVDRSNEAVTDIKIESGNESVVFMKLDLSDFGDVRRFAVELADSEPRLDILVNNTGVMLGGTLKNGMNLMLATNQLGQFLLTHLLMPLLKKTSQTSPVRIVNLSSEAYKGGRIYWDRLSPKKCESTSEVGRQYCNTKLMNVYFTSELNKHLRANDPTGNITTYSVHPGTINSRFAAEFSSHSSISTLLRSIGIFVFARSTFYGCQTTLYCCLEDGIEDKSGLYFANLRVDRLWKHARDADVGTKLWKTCEDLTGLSTGMRSQD